MTNESARSLAALSSEERAAVEVFLRTASNSKSAEDFAAFRDGRSMPVSAEEWSAMAGLGEYTAELEARAQKTNLDTN